MWDFCFLRDIFLSGECQWLFHTSSVNFVSCLPDLLWKALKAAGGLLSHEQIGHVRGHIIFFNYIIVWVKMCFQRGNNTFFFFLMVSRLWCNYQFLEISYYIYVNENQPLLHFLHVAYKNKQQSGAG